MSTKQKRQKLLIKKKKIFILKQKKNVLNVIITKLISGLCRQGAGMKALQNSLNAPNAGIHGEITAKMDSEELNKYIKDNKLKIRVKANADENKITGYDENRNVLKVNIKSPAQYNKANIEIIKLFSKKLNKKVRIKSGLTSKEKLLVLGD